MKTLAVLFFTFLAVNSCDKNSENSINTLTLWVNSETVPCEGVAPQQCLQIQRGENLQEGTWELFYTEIKGFEYEPGFIYKLKINEEKIDPATVPADASSIKYSLIEVLDKKEVLLFADQRLHDIWALQAINGTALDTNQFTEQNRQPVLEIFPKENRIGGNDGCNSLFGQISTLTANNIQFEKIGGTLMACPDMTMSNKFGQALAATRTYSLNKLSLEFYNENGEEVLQFKKVD